LQALDASDLVLVSPDEVPVADDLLAADVEPVDAVREGEHPAGDQVVRAAELEPVRSPDGDVRALAGLERADVVAAEHGRPATRTQPQCAACRHRLRAAAAAGDEQRLLHLEGDVAALVRRRAVDAQPD